MHAWPGEEIPNAHRPLTEMRVDRDDIRLNILAEQQQASSEPLASRITPRQKCVMAAIDDILSVYEYD